MTWLPVLAGLAAGAAAVLLLPAAPRAPVPPPARRWLLLVPVPGIVLLLLVGSGVPAALLLLATLLAAGGRALVGVRRRRAESTRTAERVLETCELVAAELVAGQSPVVALRRAAEEWPALAPVAEAGGLGSDPAVALHDLSRTPGAADLRLVAAAWTVAHRTGSGLADALGRVAGAIRDRRTTARVVASELASARATARLVAALPVAMLVLGGGHGSGAWEFLLGHPVGVACLAAGVTLGLAGLWWIERIADGVSR
ncbi:type II secretion system F family protein [Nocardioides sp. GXQ0305]|uniref:type II secretion system F family protein n=1 Tax=Nocardioides sp. GXQ0305 TaxID=3423912 RepID=UPI003D7C8741